jgi:hypothetical protein
LSLKKNASKTKKHRKYDGIHDPGYDLASKEFMIGSEILFFFLLDEELVTLTGVIQESLIEKYQMYQNTR